MDKRTVINLFILILVIVLAVLGYLFFAGAGSQSTSIQTTGALSPSPNATQTTADFLSVVAGLRTLRLDASVFSNPAFVALQDFGVTLTPQPVRNGNPFLPVGGAPVVVAPER